MKKILLIAAMSTCAMLGSAQARDQISIVGSSTVFPFATAVGERFGQTTEFPAPIIESTGSGGGMKLFCSGTGVDTPDVTNSSRRMKASEFKMCKENGVTPVEVVIGFDGIVLANSQDSENFDLTLEQVFLALAKQVPINGELVDNPYMMWSEIDPSLPAIKIEVLGPPPTSGTRDAFVELAMEGGAKAIPMLKDLRETDKKAFSVIAHTIREDGSYIEAGENDNLIISKLEANPNALGIFGYSFLDQNIDKVKGAYIDGAEPEFELIAEGEYPISRSLYFYVKKEHVGAIPGLAEYVAAFTAESAWSEDGYLAEKGLIPLPDEERKAVSASANALTPLEM